MSQDNKYYKDLISFLGTKPISAERFTIGEVNFSVDLLTFEDRPFKGVRSVFTNGLSTLNENKGNEVVFSFHPQTILNTDVNGFLATYVRLYYLKNKSSINVGDFFKVQGFLLD